MEIYVLKFQINSEGLEPLSYEELECPIAQIAVLLPFPMLLLQKLQKLHTNHHLFVGDRKD